MSKKEIRAIYNSLNDSGELKTFHPELTGDWDADQKKFTSLYNATENLLGGITDDDEYIGGFEFEDHY
jgi:hypothetical protein